MIELGWSRNSVSRQTRRITGAFRWGPRRGSFRRPWAELKTISPVAPGRAPEAEPIRTVPMERLHGVEDRLHVGAESRALLAAMIEVQRLTATRSQELRGIRPKFVKTEGAAWLCTVPGKLNKSYHSGKRQAYWFGPRVQRVLKPWVAIASLAEFRPGVEPLGGHRIPVGSSR